MADQDDDIGPYRLEKWLGEGGFGEVWRALDTRNGRIVAVKIIIPNPQDDFASLLNAVLKEVQAWSAAGGHPNIHTLEEPEFHAGKLLLVSECADMSLREWLNNNKNKPLSVAEIGKKADQLLAGLEHLHTRLPAIMHRDLKPENALLFGETVRLSDFGLSRAIPKGSYLKLTKSVASWEYAAPEVYDEKYRIQSDLWSVGVMLYEMLAGYLPFQQQPGPALMGAVLKRPPPPLPETVPLPVREIVMRCLAKQPKARFDSAKDMREALKKALQTPGKRRNTVPVVGSLLTAGVIGTMAIAGNYWTHREGMKSGKRVESPKAPPVQSANGTITSNASTQKELLPPVERKSSETRTEAITFKKERKPDPQMKVGEERTVQEGKPGVREIVEEVTKRNGAEIIRRTISRNVSRKPVNELIAYGIRRVRRVVREADVAFETHYVKTAKLPPGKKKESQPGQKGHAEITEEVTSVGENVIARWEVSRSVTQMPVTRIVLMGKPQEHNTNLHLVQKDKPYTSKSKATKYCINCGVRMPADARYCTNCGTNQ